MRAQQPQEEKERHMSSDGDKSGKTEKMGDGVPIPNTGSASTTEIEDLEFAIKMLRIKLGSTSDYSEKMRYYNQIKTLQENIARLKEKVCCQKPKARSKQ